MGPNGTLVREGWTFDGNTLPTDNSTYRFDVEATSDALGTILLGLVLALYLLYDKIVGVDNMKLG